MFLKIAFRAGLEAFRLRGVSGAEAVRIAQAEGARWREEMGES